MAQATLTHILEAIKSLQPHELRTVERTIRGLLDPTAVEVEREAALRVLQESGLINKIKRPMAARKEYQPVPIEGKPLSETIIEERR